MATPLEIFRTIATEFAGIDDATVGTWFDLTSPLVSRKRYGRVYEQALALLAAHRMKTAGVGAASNGSDELGDIGGVGAAFKVAAYTSGGESINFNGSLLTAKMSSDAEYTQTVYGVRYLTLRKLYAIPIVSSGEKRC